MKATKLQPKRGYRITRLILNCLISPHEIRVLHRFRGRKIKGVFTRCQKLNVLNVTGYVINLGEGNSLG